MSPTIPIPPRGGDRTSPTLEHEAPWSGSDAHGPRESGWDEQESPTWDGDRGPWRRETVLSDENPWSGHEASELEDENPWSAAETGELEDENPWSAAETGELEDETPWSDRQTLTTDDENPWSGHETGELEDENPWSGLEAGGLNDEHRDSRALDALSLDDLTSLEPTDQWSQALGPVGYGYAGEAAPDGWSAREDAEGQGAAAPTAGLGAVLGDFPDMVRRGMASAAVVAAVAAGETDERALTNRVFFARHPELAGRRIGRDELGLAQEWLAIRDRLVRPLLAHRAAARPGGSTAGRPGGGQRLRTQALREAWAAYARRGDRMVSVDVLGRRPQVNPLVVEAVRELGRRLQVAGYRADRVGGFSDRVIAGTSRLSLHAYGIALDIDARHNPHRRGRPGPARWSPATTQAERRADVAAGRADTSFTPEQVAAVRAIRTVDGIPVFWWAGAWITSPDAMHFQIDVTPAELKRGLASSPTAAQESEEETEEVLEVDEEEAGEDAQELFGPVDFIKSMFREPTVGFEFDVHYGPIPALPDSRLGDVLSTHAKATDGFEVKLDGPRLEINTRPFTSSPAGRKELQATAARIATFAGELATACRGATSVDLPGFTGARPFDHPKVSVPIGKLPINGRFTDCSVWAAPQATLTVRLARVGALVERIKASEGKGPGVALTGGSSARMGVRSEALYRALKEVRRARRAAPFSGELEGFLILLASYLWTGELPYNYPPPNGPANGAIHDYEQVGKAFLPINVKNPFHQVFTTLLSGADQNVFRSRFADGPARVNLFRLARPTGASLADGARHFLPPGRTVSGVADVVHDFQKNAFGVIPTWDDLVEHTLDPTHRGWGDRLWVTHSKKKDIDETRPRVLLELRRAGFAAVGSSAWQPFMLRVHALTADLNR